MQESGLKVFQSSKTHHQQYNDPMFTIYPMPPLFLLFDTELQQDILSPETTLNVSVLLRRKFNCEPKEQLLHQQ